jgi:hypothetical protein
MERTINYLRPDETRTESWHQGEISVVVSTSTYRDGSTIASGLVVTDAGDLERWVESTKIDSETGERVSDRVVLS